LPTENRRDLTSVPFLTIDPEDARDHDDAVYAERAGEGYRITVAIADVAEYVQRGSALDQEAIARGCTIYLPDRAIPMLPAALAADLCSLLPDRDRLCLAVIADMDRRGKITRYEVVEGFMRGAAMIAYSGVARALGFSATAAQSPQAERFKRELKVLDEVARKLRRARMKRGSLDFDLPEPKITLDDETGVPTAVVRRAGDPGVKRAYQIVEELMILANELVAQWLTKKKCPTIYRVHAKPDEQKLERLESVCEKLGAPFDLDEMLEAKGVGRWITPILRQFKNQMMHARGKCREFKMTIRIDFGLRFQAP
jgi:ribonuclease R